MAVHEITIGRSGTGKTYYVVHALVTQWLPFLHNRNFFTNLPLDLDAIAEYLIRHHPDLVSSHAMARVRLFDASVTDSWLDGKSGPWDFFKDQDLDAGRITIDEIHNYVHINSKQEYIARWRKWLGELRHAGCTFEAISQYETKIHPLIRHECGLIRRLASSDDKRDPVFWVRWYDHFQVLSKLRGYYASRVWINEYTEDAGKWSRTGGGSVALVPEFYRLYNSYSNPIAGGGHGAKLSPHPYARMTWAELVAWYAQRNSVRMLFFGALYAVFIWLFVLGGIPQIFNSVMASVNATKNPPKAQTVAPSPAKPSDLKPSDKTDKPAPTEPAKPVRVDRPAIFTSHGVFDQVGRPWSESTPHAPSPEYDPPVVAPVAHGVQQPAPGRPAPGVGVRDRIAAPAGSDQGGRAAQR